MARRNCETNIYYLVLASAAHALRVWRADQLPGGSWALPIERGWEWLPILDVKVWQFQPTRWVVLAAEHGAVYGFFGMLATGPACPLLVNALTRSRPRLLAALRPAFCQRYGEHDNAPGNGSSQEEKEVSLVQHLMEGAGPGETSAAVSRCKAVWQAMAKRKKSKQGTAEEEGGSEEEEEPMESDIEDFVLAAVDEIDGEHLPRKDKERFKGHAAVQRRAATLRERIQPRQPAQAARAEEAAKPAAEPAQAQEDSVVRPHVKRPTLPGNRCRHACRWRRWPLGWFTRDVFRPTLVDDRVFARVSLRAEAARRGRATRRSPTCAGLRR